MYKLTHEVFSHSYRTRMASALAASPYLGDSPLGPEFIRTKGFSLIFCRSALLAVLDAFPYMQEFLDTVIFPASNAFYVNPVLMSGGSEVRDHIDCRLIVSQNVRIIPNLVSIFYVLANPASKGGCFRLRTDAETTVDIQPRSGDLLHFKGNLVHSVDPVCDGSERLSLVCEQYNLPEGVLSGFPEFDIIQSADVAPRVSVDLPQQSALYQIATAQETL